MSENAVEEVREFLDRLPQRSPQEAIGMRDEGGLLQGLIFGTAGLAVLVLIGTVVPFVWESTAPKPTAAKAANERPADNADEPNEAGPPANNAAAASPASGSDSADDVPDPDKALNSLGIGEAKDAPPDVNPLEKDLDNLLDGVK